MVSICIAWLTLVLGSCSNEKGSIAENKLYDSFKNPAAEARPFVRWWWNGNKVRAHELDRELESLKNVGFGGVEINPIAMPFHAPDNGDKALVWMSDEWVDLLVHACQKTKELGMVADLIVGTGWPFGGEFLQSDETSQRVVTSSLYFNGGETITLDTTFLMSKALKGKDEKSIYSGLSKNTTHELFHLNLIPENCGGTDEVVDLKVFLDANGTLSYKLPDSADYILSFGFLQKNFRDVTLGAPGGAGPVMDHYKKEMTLAYLSRLKKISERSGIALHHLIRALFCDSIEISGANWTDGFALLFFETYGYRLDDWISFIFYAPGSGYSKENYDSEFDPNFREKLKKVRYDYNELLVKTFLSNFTEVFKDFCDENKLLSRYQAYGTPFLLGMMDGNMIADIPESNNWIYSAEMKDSLWQWNQAHGYMTWNLYASAGAHLTGKKITSSETMTNLKGVFRTSLEEIKQHDDMNFITGINHSIVHGYNYSPPEVKFPGWLRFGTFFSELNPWWQHLNHWVDYNARLSSVFQNSQADKSIAILSPTPDLWGDNGLSRGAFHTQPEYLYKLWEPISQLGYSFEYINQKIVEGATIEDGRMTYGDMTYDLIILASVRSINPVTAFRIEKFVASGGKVVVIDSVPDQSLRFKDFKENDSVVKNTMDQIILSYPNAFVQVKRPSSLDHLYEWTEAMLAKSEVAADVEIRNPSQNVFQIHQYTADKEIYFFTNVNRFETTSLDATFPVRNKYPWLWNPETGERTPFPYEVEPNELTIVLNPLESVLVVFEDEKPEENAQIAISEPKDSLILETNWTVTGEHVNGQRINWNLNQLRDFGKSRDTTQNTFAGKIIYKTTLNLEKGFTQIDLGEVNEGVTELFINDKKVGTRWYGKAIYPVADVLKKGKNTIEIHNTTVLANYTRSLKDNPAVQFWTESYQALEPTPTGLEGPLRLLQY